MKITISQLRRIIKEEVEKAASSRSTLSESHSRITQEEVDAWKRGDWGFVSESSEERSPKYDMTRDELLGWYSDLFKASEGVRTSPAGGESMALSDIEHEIDALIDPEATAMVDQPRQSGRVRDLLRARGIKAY